VLDGRSAENGKSQILDCMRGLLPPDAVRAIPPADFGDDPKVIHLVGAQLNAVDELGSAKAISSETFKNLVTGEPIVGRDLYKPSVEFRSRALHVFATNHLPSFGGGFDRGVQRRLLVLPFNRTIPKDEKI
jgi:phage/plasmid-associated DNA primase